MENPSLFSQMPAPRSILITGGAGFIGSNVLRHLWEKFPDTHFHVLDLLTYAGDIRNIDPEVHSSSRFTFWYGDVRNERLVDSIVSQAEVIVHFAAETHVARSIYEDVKFFETDVLGTHAVANAVLRHRDTVRRFIHISTSEVYGTARYEPMDEEHPLEPQSPYAAAKTGADRLVYSYIATYGIPATIVRPFNMFGPYQHLEKLIPRFITSALMGEPMTVHGDGSSQRDFSYVSDLAEAIESIMLAPADLVQGQVFNVGSSEAHSVLEIAQSITRMLPTASERMEFNPYTINIGDRPGQVFKHIGSSKKIHERLGWEPKVSFEEGLKRTIEWYVAHKEWWHTKIWMRHVSILTAEGKVELH